MERIPPHSDETEKAVLGACLLDKEALFEVLEVVVRDDFYNERHKEIYNALLSMYQNNIPVDIVTLCDELKKRKSLEMIGGRGYIIELTSNVPSVLNAKDYAKIVSEKASVRQMIRVSEDITEKGYASQMGERELIDYAESNIFKIAQKNQRNDYAKIQEVLKNNIEIIGEAAKNKGKVIGLPTGFKAFDEKTSGLQKSDLIILAARPAMGKTAFALNIAQQCAIKSNASVAIFSMEMSKEQLGQRLLSIQARVELEKLKTGELEGTDWERLSLALDDLNNTKIVIDDNPGITVMEMRNKCRRIKRDQGLDLIIVDYLQLMATGGKVENRNQEVSALSRGLKILAREIDCPVIVLSQLSREVDKRSDHEPILSDLRESGSIEQDADIVIFLYREEYYNNATEKPGICDVIIAKHRSGPTGKLELTWVPRYTKFSDKAL